MGVILPGARLAAKGQTGGGLPEPKSGAQGALRAAGALDSTIDKRRGDEEMGVKVCIVGYTVMTIY